MSDAEVVTDPLWGSGERMYPFESNRTFVRNSWYVAAFSHEVGRHLLPRTLLGEPVVLYRRGDGAPVALAGTCAHRQYPLHAGHLVGDEVRCGYHGFRFAPDGACTAIPSQERVPSRCRVAAYPVAERWKWIWIWMGDPDLADESLIPDHDLVGLSDALRAEPGCLLEVGGRYQLINDNLLDLSHISYLHARGGEERRDVVAAAREEIITDESVPYQRSRRLMQLERSPGGASVLDAWEGPVEFELTIDFWPPSFHVGCQQFRAPSADGRRGRHLAMSRFFHGITPSTTHSTFYFFAFGRDYDHDDEARTVSMRERNVAVIEEDKVAIELLEPYVDRPGRGPDFHVRADAGARRARRTIQAMLDREA